MINTNLYGVPKSNGDGGGKTTVIINGTGGTVNQFEPHYLWGQYFDDTEDINGDMTVNGNINADGNVTASSIQVNNAKVTEKLEAGQIEAADIDASNITADKADITELSGDSLDFAFANILSAFINELESNNIITKNLTVTGAAHFFELIIDKIKASGGAHLFTPADGFKIDKFEQISNGYRLYFKSTDGDKHIYNMWKTNDQAICRNFNQATATDTNYDISNKYYWCLVTNTNADDDNNGNPVDVNFGTQENPDIVPCHYIDISTEVYDGTVNPEIGDEIVMLGYRGNDDIQRQSAIYIAAYSSIDTDLIAPLICQYRGINDFNLNAHKYTWFAAGARNGYRANQITGNLILENGQTVNEYIDDSVEGKTVYSYSLMPLYQFVTISNNEATPQTIGCKILYNENNAITSLDTIPTGYKIEVYNNVDSRAIRTFTAGNNIAFNSPLKANDNITDISYLIIILIDPNNTTIDSKTISYVQSGAAGNDGEDGGHYEFRYKNATSKPATPTSGQNTDNTWSDTPTDPDYSNNEYTWMTQCFVSGRGLYGIWSEPIRITGANGKDGEDGQDGQDGADGKNGTKIEFIYTRNNTGVTPTKPPTTQVDDWPNNGITDHQTVNGVTWYDNPQGVSETQKYEYVSTRTYENNIWGPYSTPVVWSKWGEKGQDGDGYEYIYRISNTEPGILYDAYNGKTRYDDEFVPKNWSDNPLNLDEDNKLEWVATRKKENGVWSDFSTPKKWAHWSAPGTSGQDGGHWEFRYKNATSKPVTPIANQNTDNTWSETPSEPDYSNNEYTWMTQCFVSGSGAYGIWSEPIRITGADGKDGEDGVDGVDGKNGTKIEFVYTRNNTGIAPSTPPTTQVDDWPNDGITDHQTVDGVTWYDNPQGVSENIKYEYVSTRTCENDVWGPYSTPVIWSKWGEKGQDGDGYEYIYYLNNTDPSNPNNISLGEVSPSGVANGTDTNKNQDDWVPNDWSDNPQGVTSTYLYEYCSVRKKTNGRWGEFSTPSLWAHWAPAGSNGGHYEFRYKNHIPTQANPVPAKPEIGTNGTANGWSRNPSVPNIANNEFTFMTFSYVSGEGQYNEWSDPIRITGDNGKDGEDGNSVEFIYAQSETNTAPAITYTEYNSKVPSDPDFVPRDWTDNPQGVNETEQYEFVSVRAQVNGIWTNNFSVPALWSKWGEKGQDGDGFEYIYILSDDEPDNPTPANYQTNSNYQNNDEYASFLANWEDEPLQLSEDNKLEWVSTRKKHDGVWGPFSDPKVWARWASKGSDGGHWEFRYKNATSKPSTPTAGQNTDNTWSDNPTNPNYLNNEYTWMTQCFVTASNIYGTWSEPVRITGANGKDGEDGEDGKNGTKIEFVYTRNNTGIAPSAPPTTQVDDWPNDGTTDHQTINSVTWYDNPQGVSENLKYEYVSTRTCENDVWGDYSTPVIWSKWGEKGMDGDGYEYIYRLSDTADSLNPNNVTRGQVSPSGVANGSDTNKNQDDWVPNGWSDNPQGVSSASGKTKEFVSVRKKTDGNWGAFSPVALWAQYVPPGSAGQNGGRYHFLYANYNPNVASTKPSKMPDGSTEYSVTSLMNGGWTRTPSTPNFANNIYTYMTQAFFNDGDSVSVWTVPARISGDNGAAGKDGDFVEFIYTQNNTGIAPSAPPHGTYPRDWPNDGTIDHKTLGTVTWYDNPQGVSETLQYEYVSSREYNGETKQWTDYSTPVIWSKWGEKGMDGDGYEYIYCLTENENNVPQLWQTYPSFTGDKGSWQNVNKYANVEFDGSSSNSKILRWKGGTKDRNYSNTSIWHDVTEDEYLPPNEQLGRVTSASSGAPVSTWTDEPQGVSIDYKAEWVAVRKKTNTTWSSFSSPKLWSVYATNGSDGPEGPQGPEGPSGADYEGYHLTDNGSSLIAAINSSYNPIRRTVITINFKVVHQVGANITPVTDLSGYYARYKLNNTSTWSVLSKNNTTGIISGNSDIAWSDAHHYVTVELYKGTSASGTFLDSFTIVSVMEPKAIFDTSYGLYSLVQGHTAEINNISNRYTTLNQTVDGISTEVAQLDTSIDNLTGTVNGMSSSISTIDQKADSITSMVSKLSGVQLLDQTAWINADETPADIDYKMYRVSIKGTKEVSSGSTLYYVFSSMTRLVSGNTYVFSLYPGTTSSSFQVDILYSSSLVKPRECSNIVTSVTVSTLDNDTFSSNKRKTYKFTAPSTGYYTIKVKYNSSMTFYCPQLENGDAATAFDASSMCISSAIVQSADSISLKVSRCGIDINNYTINLNADTTNITGNLNLRRSDNGFTLYDTSNNPRINIKAQNIPTPIYGDSVFSSKGYAQSQSEMKTKVASGEVNAVTSKVSIGAFNSGNTIMLTIYPEIYGIADSLWTRNNNSIIRCTAKLYRNTSSTASYTSEEKTLQRTGSIGEYTYPSFTWTVSNVLAGTYYVEVAIKATDSTNGYTQYYVYSYTEYTKEVTSLTYIGLDGLLVGATNNHFAKISKDGIELRWLGTTNNVYGGTSIRLDNNGLKRVYDFNIYNGPLSWVNFDGYTKATVLTSSDFTRTSFYYGNNYITEYNYIMKADDVIIFIHEILNNFSSSSTLYIRLGDGVGGTNPVTELPPGRHVCIRNFSSKTVYVCSGETSSGYCILDRDDHDYVDRWNTEHAFCTFMTIPGMTKNNYNINWCCAQRA